MRRSNIVLTLLAVVFFAALCGNIYYHKLNFEPKRAEFERVVLYEKHADSIKVVCLNDTSKLFIEELEILKKDNVHMDGTQSQLLSFYRDYKINGDTLFMPKTICIATSRPEDVKFEINLPKVEQVYINGKITKQFNAKQ